MNETKRAALEAALIDAGMEPRKALGESRRLARDIADDEHWANVKEPCSGPGYAHAPHGACPGYGTDRT